MEDDLPDDDPLDDLREGLDEIDEILESGPETYPLLKEHTGYSDEFNRWFLAYDSALRGTRDDSILPALGPEADDVSGPADVIEPPEAEDMALRLNTYFGDMVEEGFFEPYDVALRAAESSLESNMEARAEAESGEIEAARNSYGTAVDLLSDAVIAADALFTSYEDYFDRVREEIGEVISVDDDISVRQNLRQAERNFEKFSTFYANEVIHGIQEELRDTAENYIGDEKLVEEAYQVSEHLKSG